MGANVRGVEQGAKGEEPHPGVSLCSHSAVPGSAAERRMMQRSLGCLPCFPCQRGACVHQSAVITGHLLVASVLPQPQDVELPFRLAEPSFRLVALTRGDGSSFQCWKQACGASLAAKRTGVKRGTAGGVERPARRGEPEPRGP